MTKVVFHLGDRKTGSTAIQHALSASRWVCEGVNLLYPQAHRISHLALAQTISGELPARRTADLFKDILTEIRDKAPDVAVISSEHFEAVAPEDLHEAVQTHMPDLAANARYIAYVRPHADRIVSSFAEVTKNGRYFGTMAETLPPEGKLGNLNYARRFGRWQQTFQGAFELRPMVRETLFRQDVIADFLQFTLGTDDFTVLEVPNPNESLSLENLAIVRRLHQKLSLDPESNAQRPAVGRALARRMNESAFREGTKVQVHRKLAEEVVRRFARDAALLDKSFFRGTPMTDALNAAPVKAVENEQSLQIEDHFTAREQYLINLWIDQTAALMKTDPARWAAVLREENLAAIGAASPPPKVPKARKVAGRLAAKPKGVETR